MNVQFPCEPPTFIANKAPTPARRCLSRADHKPLTLPYWDLENRIIQLWKVPKYGLVGAILDAAGKLTVISGKNIHNPLNSKESPEHLVARLENCGLRYWQIAYQVNFSIEDATGAKISKDG